MFISLSKPHAVYGAADNTESSEITLLESDLSYQTLFFRYILLSFFFFSAVRLRLPWAHAYRFTFCPDLSLASHQSKILRQSSQSNQQLHRFTLGVFL